MYTAVCFDVGQVMHGACAQMVIDRHTQRRSVLEFARRKIEPFLTNLNRFTSPCLSSPVDVLGSFSLESIAHDLSDEALFRRAEKLSGAEPP